MTGAGSAKGIGRSTLLEFASAGASVIYAADLDISPVDSLAEAVKEINPSCIVVGAKLDVGSGEATKALLQKILQERGQFDFFVAAAGFVRFRTFWNQTEEQIHRQFQAMAVGVFHAIQLGSRAMLVTSPATPKPKVTSL